MRAEGDKSIKELIEDMKILDEGRRKRRLLDTDFVALAEGLADMKSKFDIKAKEGRETIHKQIFFQTQNFRMEPVGMDRHYFRYWLLPSVPGLLVESVNDRKVEVCSVGCLCGPIIASRQEHLSGSSWWHIKDENDINELKKNLLIAGEREVALKRSLEAQLHFEAFKTSTPSVSPVIAVDRRVVSVITPDEPWDVQLHNLIKDSLESLCSNLLKNWFGGIQVKFVVPAVLWL